MKIDENDVGFGLVVAGACRCEWRPTTRI